MDPNAVLKAIRAEIDRDDDYTNAGELGELFDALNGWLCKGGALPHVWRNAGSAPTERENLEVLVTGSPGEGFMVEGPYAVGYLDDCEIYTLGGEAGNWVLPLVPPTMEVD